MPAVVETTATTQNLKSLPGYASGRRKKWLKTAAFWALGLFVTLNGIFYLTSSDDKKPAKGSANDSVRDLWSGTGSIDLAINGLAALKERPTVVLLGSSLMMHPFWTMDLEVNPKNPDIFHYHGSVTLERELAKDGCPRQHVYSLAIFGQMVSDAYIYVNDFLKGAKKPDVLVFGIAPRDFSDSDLPAPMATFTFKRLVGLNNFSRYADAYLPGWQEKADFVATHSVYLYGKRWRLQHEVEKAVDKAYNLFGIPREDTAQEDPSKNTAGFMLSGSTEERWQTSTREYRRRYHDIGNKDLTIQIGFLSKLLKVCQERGIKVVLVNMPLSEKNRELLAPGFYPKFRRTIAEMAGRPDVKFVDLGDAPGFTDNDFWDTAHLNQLGGHKLVQHIAPAIVSELKETQAEQQSDR